MLPTVWFFIWGALWAIFFMTDGYNLGLSSLLFLVTRSESERRQAVNTMAPFWDPNEVWIIAAGGMTFAVFPIVYATLFSSLYAPMLLVLFGLIFRDVALEFRHKRPGPLWNRVWDLSLVLGSIVPTILFGVLFANLFRGMPIDREGQLQGGLLIVLNPYALVGGLLFLVMFALHGLLWLAAKTQGVLYDRAVIWAKWLWAAMLVVLVLFLGLSYVHTNLVTNYLRYPVLWILPAIVVVSLLLVRVFLNRQSPWTTLFASGIVIFFIVMTTLAGLYPAIVPSTLDPAFSLTIHNAAASSMTLKLMLIISVIFVPIIVIYQAWASYLFSGKVRDQDIGHKDAY